MLAGLSEQSSNGKRNAKCYLVKKILIDEAIKFVNIPRGRGREEQTGRHLQSDALFNSIEYNDNSYFSLSSISYIWRGLQLI